jgi:hypothetical protein
MKSFQMNFKNFLQDKSDFTFAVNYTKSMNIYKINYFSSLSKSIRAKFPDLLDSMEKSHGTRFVNSIIYKYITCHNSTSPNLDLYGSDFLKYVSNNPYVI